MRIDTSNPYVGLRPFEMDESILFFGRNEQTLELLQRLHQHHFVAVVGSSGCGKSSLLRAGLIPALKAGYLVEDSDHWFIAIMKPGQSPLYNLAESILQQINPVTNTADVSALVQKINEEGADAILNLIAPVRKEKKVNFLLLADQFEELFRFSMDQKDVARKDAAIDFVNIILELSQQNSVPFYVVLTMRSDFIGDCDQFYGLPEAMNKSQYLVPRLNRIELKMVIEGPAKLYGGKLNSSLTSLLINELGKVKDELPLLQHSLMRMWNYEMNVNKSGELDLEDYKNIGGIEKALSNHADEALAGMSEEELRITKKMFQALTAIDENGRKIRRPVLLSQLKELTGATEEKLLSIIDLFIKDRRSFLIINKSGGTGDKIIDISHESLIRQWNTLSHWVDEEGESAINYLRLAQSAKLYKQKQKDFLTGSELQIALAWYAKFKPVAAWANRYKEGFEESIGYLIASEKESNARQMQEEERQRKEKASKQKLRYLTFGIVFLLLLGIGAVLAWKLKTKSAELVQSKVKNDSLEIEKKSLVTTANERKNDLDSLLLGNPIFNLQKYAKEKSIPMIAKNSNNEDSLAFEFNSPSKGIVIKGFLEPLMESKKISVAVILKRTSKEGGIFDATNGNYGFYIGLNDDKPRFDIYYGNRLHFFKEDFNPIDKEWKLLLFTYSNETNKIVVQQNNGKQDPRSVAAGREVLFNNDLNIKIGGPEIWGREDRKYGDATFSGLIENILVYDHVLTPEEVNNLHVLYKHLFEK